jgi:hypothetical protein
VQEIKWIGVITTAIVLAVVILTAPGMIQQRMQDNRTREAAERRTAEQKQAAATLRQLTPAAVIAKCGPAHGDETGAITSTLGNRILIYHAGGRTVHVYFRTVAGGHPSAPRIYEVFREAEAQGMTAEHQLGLLPCLAN